MEWLGSRRPALVRAIHAFAGPLESPIARNLRVF